MSKTSSKSTASAKRKSTTAAASSTSSSARNPKLDWDYENTMSFAELADAVSAKLNDVLVGFNTNSDGEEFPVLRVKTTKKSLANKLPKEARGYLTFALSMNMREQMEEADEQWDLDYVAAHARSFGFIPHPEGYENIGKLCLLGGGKYATVDLSDLLEDEDDE